MTCGQDKTVKLWNPHRDSVETPNEALLIKTYEGRHGYNVQDVAMYEWKTGNRSEKLKAMTGCVCVGAAVRTITRGSLPVAETETYSCGTCRLPK
jgi:hypothetical protein